MEGHPNNYFVAININHLDHFMPLISSLKNAIIPFPRAINLENIQTLALERETNIKIS